MKKIRGKKRKYKLLDVYLDIDYEMMLDELEKNEVCYIKFWYPNFYNLFTTGNEDMPHGFKERMLEIVIKHFQELDKILQKKYKKYDIAIWYFDDFSSPMEIVIGVNERGDCTNKRFTFKSDVKVNFSKYGNLKEEFNKLSYTSFKYDVVIEEEEFLQATKTKQKNYIGKKKYIDDILFVVSIGDIQIIRKK